MKRISATLPGRVLALLLTLCLLFTAGAVTAFADEAEYPYRYPEEQPYYELSMYTFKATTNGEEIYPYYYGGIHRLLNGDKTYLVYCADFEIEEQYGFNYKAVPLSENERTKGNENKLRAIIQNSYPFIKQEEMIQRMKNDGVTLNDNTIPCYEMILISAVSQAIYECTNPEVVITNRCPGAAHTEDYQFYIDYNLLFNKDEKYFEVFSGDYGPSYPLKEDVTAVVDWLKGLAPVDKPTITVNTSFEARVETLDGGYSLQLYNLSDDLKAAVDLKVVVKASGVTVCEEPVELGSDGNFQTVFSCEQELADTDVTVELTGGKLYDDVVAYESEVKEGDDPSTSQPFIGKGQVPEPFIAEKTVKIPAKVSVPVQKVWNDNDNADGIRPASVTVHLYANNQDTGKTLTLNDDNGWKGTFTGLDATVGGVSINYTVKEDPVTGYDSKVETAADGFTITNTSRGAISICPADITIYMGGEEGYDAVVGSGSELLDKNNSLPRPLFHITAPEGVKPEDLKFISSEVIPGTEIPKEWTVSVAGETREHVTLYYLETVNAGQDDVRIQYTKDDGSAITSDQFDPNVVEDLYLDYTAKLYTGTVDVSGVRAVDTNNNKDYGLRLGEGTLRVRAVEDGSGTPETNPVYGVQSEEPTERLEADTAAVVADKTTQYRLNHTTVSVDAKGVGLLFDDIYDKDNGQDQREKTLIECSDKAIGPAASNVTRYHQAKYLDLVDQNNGNAWVKTVDESVKVVWAYPEGTDKNTSFTLLHFAGLHRDDADDASSGYETTDIQAVKPETMTITKTDAGITFEVSSGGFSPFVLIWEKAKPAPEKEEESTTPAATPKPTPVPADEAQPVAAPVAAVIPQTGDDSQPLVWVALVLLSGAALAGLAVYRKKRSDK